MAVATESSKSSCLAANKVEVVNCYVIYVIMLHFFLNCKNIYTMQYNILLKTDNICSKFTIVFTLYGITFERSGVELCVNLHCVEDICTYKLVYSFV